MKPENMTPKQLAMATRLVDAAITGLEAMQALVETKPLAKVHRIGVDEPKPEPEPLAKATKAEEELSDARLGALCTAVSRIIGSEDPTQIASVITAALSAPVDMGEDTAVLMAKAATVVPMLVFGPAPPEGVSDAEQFFARRLEPLEAIMRNAAGGHATATPGDAVRLRELRSDVDAVAVARTLRPNPRPQPAPYVDRRPELRALRDLQREVGNFAGAEITAKEILTEEVRAAVHTPLPPSKIPWGGVAPFTPPAA